MDKVNLTATPQKKKTTDSVVETALREAAQSVIADMREMMLTSRNGVLSTLDGTKQLVNASSNTRVKEMPMLLMSTLMALTTLVFSRSTISTGTLATVEMPLAIKALTSNAPRPSMAGEATPGDFGLPAANVEPVD
jgi:hypothetical protein